MHRQRREQGLNLGLVVHSMGEEPLHHLLPHNFWPTASFPPSPHFTHKKFGFIYQIVSWKSCQHHVMKLWSFFVALVPRNVYWKSSYVMRSRGISRKLYMWHFQFSIFIEVLIWRGKFCWKPHLNRSSGSNLWAIEDSQNNRKQLIFVSSSGCISQSILPTSDWSR